ncbi:MAG: molybdate transporter family protein, partial [Planctomycetota bacterium]
GIQLTTGVVLVDKGIRLILGETFLQQHLHGASEPALLVQSLGPIPIGIVLGIGAVLLILWLGDNKRAPAILVALGAGAVIGLALGAHHTLVGLHFGLHLPEFLPHEFPSDAEKILNIVVLALTVLALPQIPLTVGNAIVSQADLTREYFGEKTGKRQSFRALALSMGLANVAAFFVGGMPMCHGSGGLAAHYRFGARTAGANLMIGPLFILAGVLLGGEAHLLFGVIPLSVLGALLVFAGIQLALMILDVRDRKDLFITLAMLGIALATNLAVGFAAGLLLAAGFRYTRMKV